MYGPLVNEEKDGLIEWNQKKYWRFALKTPVIYPHDNLNHVIETYAKPHLHYGDTLFLSEKMIACTEGRAIPTEEIEPSRMAKLLCRFVHKNPHGVGLSIPQTMEMAIRECGLPRILGASIVSALGKLLGRRGWFYKVAGYRASSIDGPCPKTVPPYNQYVVLGPADPDNSAQHVSDLLAGIPVMIVDANDFGINILGGTISPAEYETYCAILRDNPLGQTDEQTPMGLIRPVQ